MNGVIIEDSERKYVRLKNVFQAIGSEVEKYNWLISEFEYASASSQSNVLSKPFTWISGEDLFNQFQLDEGFWVWGVFSGFSKEISMYDVLKHPLPYADGYGGFWNPELTIQHPLAEVELVQWDGVLFLAITDNQIILDGLKTEFQSARDLREYNLEE